MPHEIIEVDPAIVEAFLGRVNDPPAAGNPCPAAAPEIDSAFL